MRTKVTLALLFLNVVLFYTIFYLRNDTRVEADPNLVVGPTAGTLRALKIETAGGAIALEQRDDQWVITQPVSWTANDFAVRAIVSELNGLRSETSFAVAELAASGQSLADYGLDKPALTVTLTPSEPTAKPTVLELGNATQGGNRLYILSPDRTRIHVVSSTLAEKLRLGLGDIRAETLFNISVYEAQTLTVENGPGQRTLLRRDGERWNIETLQARASRVDTELCLGDLAALRLIRFAENPADAVPSDAFSLPELRVTIEGNRRREILLLAKPWKTGEPVENATTYLARMEDDPARNGTLFFVAMPDALMSRLKRAQRELREKRLLEFDPAAVTSVSLRSLDGEVIVQRLDAAAPAGTPDGVRWQLVERRDGQSLPPAPADNARVESLMKDLTRLAAEDFTNDAPSVAERESYGLVRPIRTIALTLPGAKGGPDRTLAVQIGNGTDHSTYASIADREPVYRVSPEILQAIPVDAAEYRSRSVRELPTGAEFTHLRLENIRENKVLLDTDVKGPQPPAAVQTLASRLRTLRAQRFLPGPFTDAGASLNGAEYPWTYRIEAAVALGGSDQTQNLTLLLTERVGGTTWIAGAPASNTVFVIEQELADALFGFTYGPRDVGAPATVPASAP